MAAFRRFCVTLRVIGTVFLAVLSAGDLVSAAQEPDHDLHELAKQAGGKLVLSYTHRSTIYLDIERLALDSDLVVVGRTLGHRARLRPDGKFVTKDFWVVAQSVLKGDVSGGHTILVSLPGGSYMFPDRTYVYVKPNQYQQAEDGRIYVFFLKNKGSVYAGHPLVGTGLFDITGGTVQPADRWPSNPLLIKYKDKPAAGFLKEIERVVARSTKR